MEANRRSYKKHIGGYITLAYLTGESDESARKKFMYVNDGGRIVAIRYEDWKAVVFENGGIANEV